MTSDDQWHRIWLPKDELASGAIGRFVMDSLLPATEQLSGKVDMNTVAIFDVDDSEGGKYLYFSPGAFSSFLTLARAQGAQPCDRPAPESSLLYGDEWSARRLLRPVTCGPGAGRCGSEENAPKERSQTRVGSKGNDIIRDSYAPILFEYR